MKDSIPLKPLKHTKKRSHSPSESDSESSQSSSESDRDSFPLSKRNKSRSPERIEISSDSESSLIEKSRSRKKKKHKHSDVENAHVIHDGHNEKRHRHRCHRHHHHHHGHHRHHRLEGAKDREGRTHRRLCSKHKMPINMVKVKEEPMDDDYERTRQSHTSHRRPEQRRERSADDDRFHNHPETSSRRRPDRKENTYPRREGNNNRNERAPSNERQTITKRSKESNKDDEGNNDRKKSSRPQGRKNRWGNDEETTLSTNRPIKQEPNDGEYEWGKKSDAVKDGKKLPPGQKDKPNFGLSGKLTEDTNTFNGVVIKYSEPPEARKPKRRWRFYPFKGDQGLPTLYIHRQSSYLIGRDRKVADIPVDHPSCSKQHAALQYRLVPFERVDGSMGKRVRPYIIDLESANGTYVNNVKIEAKTYVELLEKDVVKFGYSSREYVLLHEQSKDEDLDDDVVPPGPNE